MNPESRKRNDEAAAIVPIPQSFFLVSSFPDSLSPMIGEGIHSTNQRKHTYVQDRVEVGFFTDPSVCIGCKACEVACKEWNEVPGRRLHLDGQFLRQHRPSRRLDLATRPVRRTGHREGKSDRRPDVGLSRSAIAHEDPFRWLFLSDVCKHCEEAGCLEACPTGSIVRTEVGSVLVQNDVCNGCGYCVVSCPFGVIDHRPEPLPDAGGAFKCTFCYDRQKSGLVPACAKVCPTESIVFGRARRSPRARGQARRTICRRKVTPTRKFTIRRRHQCAAFTRSS